MAKIGILLILFVSYAVVFGAPHHYLSCPHLYNPLYGHVTASGYAYGNTARYYCQNGYSMYSTQYGLFPLGSYYLRTCMDGGIWSGILPRCGKHCNFLLIILLAF